MGEILAALSAETRKTPAPESTCGFHRNGAQRDSSLQNARNVSGHRTHKLQAVERDPVSSRPSSCVLPCVADSLLGAVLGFAMELGEKGLLDTSLHFGDPTGVSELIQDIAHRRGLGHDLAEGTKRMAARFGGTEFAPHVKGLTQEDDTLPDRILYEPTFEGQTSGHPLDQLLPAYYKKRGWDEIWRPEAEDTGATRGEGLMSVTVELTYEMGKAVGEMRFELEASDVASVIEATRPRIFESGQGDFDTLNARAAVAVNGVLLRHRREAGTRLRDGDRVGFVKAAAGG